MCIFLPFTLKIASKWKNNCPSEAAGDRWPWHGCGTMRVTAVDFDATSNIRSNTKYANVKAIF